MEIILYPFIVIAFLTASALAVDITHFSVPQFVNRKDEVTLECHFKMSSPHETLHSVKWYRIDHTGAMEDFFTFIPANNPPVKTHSRSGIKVDTRQSNVRQVTLRKASLSTTGVYRCEVTSKLSPGIDSKIREDRLVVLELPEEGPVISGGLSNYQLGEQLQLNCTSPRTFPPTLLKWYINNQLATEQGTIQYPSKRGTKNGLFRTQIGLNMTVSRECFKYGQIRVKCVGIIEDGILQGYSSQGSDGSSHQILEILLPEKLKRERPPATFFVNAGSRIMDYSMVFMIFSSVMAMEFVL